MRTSKHPQRGSILILGALAISIGVIILASIDIGFMYWDKREYQKAADLAALAGAKALAEQINAGETNPAKACASANTTAKTIAHSNLRGRPFAAPDELTPATSTGGNCGLWLPVDGGQSKPSPACRAGTADARITKPLGTERSNAVRAVIHGARKHWLLPGESTPLTACAVAATTPSAQAQLKIRSTLATVEDGAVNALLGALTGSSAALNVGG